ncbi:MAG: ANTAR domain-containing protein [Blautia sp.]|nr:ANTAR domain-containing protein [Blautia sp.]
MPGSTDRISSILIVSGSEQFTAIFKKVLSRKGIMRLDTAKSAASARRRVLETPYDIVVINSPLQEEFGHDLARDVSEKGNTSVLMVVPSEVYETVMENVTDYGILVISKPLSGSMADKTVRFLIAGQKRYLRLEKRVRTLEEKMEELRIVSKAKLFLIEQKHMTEEEAHRYIGKQAMDHGVSRRRIAEQILE